MNLAFPSRNKVGLAPPSPITHRRSAQQHGCSIAILLAAALLLLAPPSAEAAVMQANMRVPSDSTGSGSLAARVYYPDDPAHFRYGAVGGAPVVVMVPGGFGVGSLTASPLFSEQGFIAIAFLFPGGAEGAFRSDGAYDDRGDNCHRALRDVLRFAAGAIGAVDGRSLSQIVHGRIRTEGVGLLGLSNGGSISIAALGRYGEQIPPLGFVVGWESPTNDQILTTEMGSKEADPDQTVDADGDRLPANDGPNPAYRAYGFPAADVAYDRLRYDSRIGYRYRSTPGIYRGLFFFDGNGNGLFDANPAGSLQTDTNGNGCIDSNEDYPIAGLPTNRPDGSFVAYLSTGAVEAAVRNNLADPWPSHMALPSETQAYWAIRNANGHFAAMAAKQPELAGMTVYSITDHVQIATDHPHVHHYLDGFQRNGLWFRLNPDREYVLNLVGRAPMRLADNNANINPSPAEMQRRSEPSGVPSAQMLQVAAVSEMADRCIYRLWDVNLNRVLSPADGSPSTTQLPSTSTTAPSSTSTTPSGSTTSTTQPSTTTSVVSSTTTTSAVTTTTLGGQAAARYFTFVVNCHDWVNPDLSAATLSFVMDTLERHGLRGEFYLTAPLLEALVERQPAFVERLKLSRHTISYHVRPPHPLNFRPTAHFLEQYTLGDYETYHMDLRTGDLDRSRAGGYDYVARIMGRNPVAVGLGAATPDLQKEYAAVLAARGARLGVFEHQSQGESGFTGLHHPEQGLYPRPADYFLARTDASGHPSGDTGNFWWNRISGNQMTPAALAAVFTQDFLDAPAETSAPRFGIVVIHENDFYSNGAPWAPVYYADAQGTPLNPPYNLTAQASWVTPRTAAQQQAIRDAFEALASAAAASPGTAVVTSEDIAGLADGYFQPDTLPTATVNWMKEPGLENDPPPDYGWAVSSLPGTANSAFTHFGLSAEAARRGHRGMAINAGLAGSASLQVRVDLDKGRNFRYGGWVKGSGPGSITFSLIPVDWVGGTLQPISTGAPASTRTLRGTFDWTLLTGETYISDNFAFAVLLVNVQGGGQFALDDFVVQSVEDATVAFPAQARGTTHLGFLIHIENIAALKSDTPYYRAKTQVLKDLAEMFHRHGAFMTIQPELEWLQGVAATEPDLVRRLHQQYGVEFSVHTHGPKGVNPSPQQVLAYIYERKQAMESAGSGPVTDLNGNFDQPDWSLFAAVGIRSMTAFKNTRTQACYEGNYFHPWRPPEGNPYINEAAWAVDSPNGKVFYLPGACTQVTKHSDYLFDNVLPGLSTTLANAAPDKVTTWYFIGHVDSFSPKDGSSLEAYMNSEQYRKDLDAYDRLLGEILGPLVRRGLAVWSSPSRMRAAAEQ